MFDEGHVYRHNLSMAYDILVIKVLHRHEDYTEVKIWFMAKRTGAFIDIPFTVKLLASDYEAWTQLR